MTSTPDLTVVAFCGDSAHHPAHLFKVRHRVEDVTLTGFDAGDSIIGTVQTCVGSYPVKPDTARSVHWSEQYPEDPHSEPGFADTMRSMTQDQGE